MAISERLRNLRAEVMRTTIRHSAGVKERPKSLIKGVYTCILPEAEGKQHLARDIVQRIHREVSRGAHIPKPEGNPENYVFLGWGTRNGHPALVYQIHGLYIKKITKEELRKAYQQLLTAGEFTKRWFKTNLEQCHRQGDCNFTTIGGLFELLGLAHYGA